MYPVKSKQMCSQNTSYFYFISLFGTGYYKIETEIKKGKLKEIQKLVYGHKYVYKVLILQVRITLK